MQLFLTLASLPILVAWGIPVSRLSVLGNLFFNPFIFLFLLLSSAIFFLEIMHIPHALISWLLENLTFAWKLVLPFHGSHSLCGFGKPPLWLLILLGTIPFLLTAHPRLRAARHRIIALSLLFIMNMALIQATSPHLSGCLKIPCHGSELTLLLQDNKTILIDPGAMGRRISAPSFAAYTLTPELISKTGRLTIDYLILCKPTIMTFEAVRTLCDTITIENIYIPYLYGELSGPLRVAWAKMYGTLHQQQTTIHRIYENRIEELHDKKIALSLKPVGKKTYRDMSYPCITIQGFVDHEPITIERK